MGSEFWSCSLVLAGLVALVNGQCLTNNLLFTVFIQPTSTTVTSSSDVTLTCIPSNNDVTSFSWHRVNGVLPMRSSGQNTDKFTIHNVRKTDEGEYYCTGVQYQIHCAVSNNAIVLVKVESKACPPLSDPNNGMMDCLLGGDGTPSSGETCSFTCNTGYELTGSESRTCQSNGSWSGSITTCNRVSCPSLSEPSNGMINCLLGDDGIPSFEDTCSFTCNLGYELTGSNTRTCQSNGSWSGNNAMCNRVSCPLLSSPSNGMINCSLGDDEVPSYEDTCSFTCNPGYELTGSNTRTCQSNGSWSGNNAMCNRVSCPSLSEPSNGIINCSLGDDEVPSYEDICNFTCDTGYELTGSESRTCQSDGSWSDNHTMCNRVSCQSLSEPSNGMMDCSLGDDGVPSYEDTCNFTCNTGYELTGSDFRTCQSDGSWSGSNAVCNRVSCSSLTAPSNGTISCSGDGVPSYEDTCSFTCNSGYELTGSENRTCQSDRSWSGNHTMCNRVSCPSLSEPSNGMINCSLGDDGVLSHEDTCSFTCNTGYKLTGSESRTCQNDGSWSGSITMCNRELAIQFSNSTFSGLESSGIISVTLILEGGTSASVITVTVQPFDQSPVSAQGNGVDYTSAPITATFSAGSTSATIDIPVSIDDTLEEREIFNLNFSISSSLSGQVIPGNITTATGIIIDDTNATVRFGQAMYTVDESDGVVEILLILSNPSSTISLITVFALDKSAEEGFDFDSGPYNVIFPPNTINGSFNISITNDAILEQSETFTLNICPPDDFFVIDPDEAVVTIVDDDNGTLFFTKTVFKAEENVGSITLELTLSNPSSNNITVQIESVDKSTTGEDYVPGPYNATFLAGSNISSFIIKIIDDNIFERTEEFGLIFSQDSLPLNIIGYSDQANVTIMDDDGGVRVSFNQSSYTVYENDGVLPVLTLSNPSSFDVTITIRDVGVTAKRNTDYIPGPYNVTIPSGQTSSTFNISVIDNDDPENDKRFNLIIIRDSLMEGFVRGSNRRITVNIVDDDKRISFEDGEYVVNEAENLQPVLTLSNPVSMPMTIEVLSFNNGSATGGQDYNTGPFIVEISAGMTRVPFNVSVSTDSIFEGNETFYLLINASTLPREVSVEDPGQTTVTIVDDDDATVRFGQTMYTVDESDGVVEILLILSNPSSTISLITVFALDESAEEGFDFDSGPYNVIFPPNTINASFDISITNDAILELNETFTLNICPPDDFSVVDPAEAVVTIVDDDVLTIQFSNSTFSGLESSGIISVTLILEGGTSASVITVTVQPFDQSPVSAQGNGVDYTSVPITATFSVGSTSTTIDIPVSIDDTLEERETFNLNFSIPSPLSHPVIPGNITTATGIIVDDTNATVRFGQAMYTVDESDGVVEILLVLSNPSSTILFITVFALDESAEEGVDFDSGPYNVIFPPYTTTVSFNVSITNDFIMEQNENFTLNICPPDGFFVADPDKAVVTIVDDTRNCTVEGQVFQKCGEDPECATTCANRFSFISCPQVCNGVCTCPNGTIIDEDSNKCVPSSECPEIPCPGIGQVFGTCNPVNATCSNPIVPSLCDVGFCACPSGQVLDELTNTCINVSQCRCPIKGQIRVKCASHPNCTKTCKEVNEPTKLCIQSCVPNGCECPNGTALDEEKNECVSQSECPGACKVERITGNLSFNGTNPILTFSANHSAVFYQCRFKKAKFMDCESPLFLNQNFGFVAVRAFCYVDGKPTLMKMKRFKNTF